MVRMISAIALAFGITATSTAAPLEELVANPHLFMPGLNATNKQQIDCAYIASRNPIVIFAAGQSLVANANGDIPRDQVIHPNIYEQWGALCYKANAPLYGGSDGRQSFLLPLADMVARSTGRDVVISVAALGGKPIREFISGDANNLLLTQIHNTKAAGLKPDVFLWEHGQADIEAPADYLPAFRQIVQIVRKSGVSAPIFATVDTFLGWSQSQELEAVQGEINEIAGVNEGPNIDLITYRLDGTHLDQRGMEMQAAMWFQVLASHFDW